MIGGRGEFIYRGRKGTGKDSHVRLEGWVEFERKLKKMPDKIGGKVLVAATRAGAAVIGKRARELAPVADQTYTIRGGDKVEPGRLRKSIKWKKSRTIDKRRAAFKIAPMKDKGKSVYYWTFVEFGRTYKHAGRKRQSFMRPALAQSKNAALDAMRKKMAAELAKAARSKV